MSILPELVIFLCDGCDKEWRLHLPCGSKFVCDCGYMTDAAGLVRDALKEARREHGGEAVLRELAKQDLISELETKADDGRD